MQEFLEVSLILVFTGNDLLDTCCGGWWQLNRKIDLAPYWIRVALPTSWMVVLSPELFVHKD